MRIDGDRTELTNALEDDEATLLVLSGDGEGAAGAIDDLFEGRPDREPWRRSFVVIRLADLTAEEQAAWFGGRVDAYAVLGGGTPKRIGPRGALADLQLADGRPSILRIRQAFAKGDQL